MTVRGRVANFLKEQHKPYCDDCLGTLLELGSAGNRDMAYAAAASLTPTAEFKRQIGACTECGKPNKFVTRAVESF